MSWTSGASWEGLRRRRVAARSSGAGPASPPSGPAGRAGPAPPLHRNHPKADNRARDRRAAAAPKARGGASAATLSWSHSRPARTRRSPDPSPLGRPHRTGETAAAAAVSGRPRSSRADLGATGSGAPSSRASRAEPAEQQAGGALTRWGGALPGAWLAGEGVPARPPDATRPSTAGASAPPPARAGPQRTAPPLRLSRESFKAPTSSRGGGPGEGWEEPAHRTRPPPRPPRPPPAPRPRAALRAPPRRQPCPLPNSGDTQWRRAPHPPAPPRAPQRAPRAPPPPLRRPEPSRATAPCARARARRAAPRAPAATAAAPPRQPCPARGNFLNAPLADFLALAAVAPEKPAEKMPFTLFGIKLPSRREVS